MCSIHFQKLNITFFSLVPSPQTKLVGTALGGQSKATIKTRSDTYSGRKLTKQCRSGGWNTLLLDKCRALQGPGVPGSFQYHELNLHRLAEV